MRPRLRLEPAILTLGLVAAACTEAVAPDPSGTQLEVVAEGLEEPLFVTFAPGDPRRLFVIEKPGRIRVIRDGVLLAQPFLAIEASTSRGNERGLLGMAFDPEYATNGHVFVNHTDVNGDTEVLRFTAADPDAADPASLEVVLQVAQPFANHNGGDLKFGPDGMLYVALGDGGDGGDPLGHGQDRGSLLGSLLRLDVSTLPYAVPADNPFVGVAGAAPEVFAYGLRNPWRFSFDRDNGDLWIGDVGQRRIEEVSWASFVDARGANFGWAITEGTRCYPTDPCDTSGLVAPIYEYEHTEGCSVTGGYVYRGQAMPSFVGRYFLADYCRGWIRSLRRDGSTAADVFDHTASFGTVGSIASFGEDLVGELYVVSLSGTVYRMAEPG